MVPFDVGILNLINGFAGRWPWLDAVGIFCAVYLAYILLFSLVVFLCYDFRKYWRMVSSAVVTALFVRFVLVEIFYHLHFKFRPFVVNFTHPLISYDPGRTSFPSGHASFFFALSTILYGYNKRVGIIFYIASSLIVLGRIFVGVHWPSDVIVGIFIGVVMGLILNKMFKKFHPLKYFEEIIK